jgi:hypothetical protein
MYLETQSLHDIAVKHRTDKAEHLFTNVYDEAFSHLRDKNIRFLEVGIWMGASINMWRDYFKNAEIFAADIMSESERKETSLTYEGGIYSNIEIPSTVKTFVVNQEKESELLTLPDNLDIIIEDGGHTMLQQQITLNVLFNNKLNPGGYYVLEDLHTSENIIYAAGHVWSLFGGNQHNRTLELLYDLQAGCIRENNQYYISGHDFTQLLEQIEYIKIFKVKLGSTTSIIKKKEANI